MKNLLNIIVSLTVVSLSGLAFLEGCTSDPASPATTTLPAKGKGSLVINGKTYNNVTCSLRDTTYSDSKNRTISYQIMEVGSLSLPDSALAYISFACKSFPTASSGSKAFSNWGDILSDTSNTILNSGGIFGFAGVGIGSDYNNYTYYGTTTNTTFTKTASNSFTITGTMTLTDNTAAPPVAVSASGTY